MIDNNNRAGRLRLAYGFGDNMRDAVLDSLDRMEGRDWGWSLMHPLICRYQITPKISLNTRCSASMLPNFSIKGRLRSSGQLGRW